MFWIAVLFFVGLTLSAFFSGSETGFYRLPRVRLVIDGVAGDRIAQGLLWASNHPEAFVATALVGNNVANYLVSTSVVLVAGLWFSSAGLLGELGLTLLLTPVVFIFGELLPKRAFLQSPYGLLRRCTPALVVAGGVLAIPSGLLWLASRVLSRFTSASIEPLRMTLRRRELADVFEEGQEVGLLSQAQRDLALAIFSLGGRPVRDFMTPVGRQPKLPADASDEVLLRLTWRYGIDSWPTDLPSGSQGAVRASLAVTRDTEEPALPVEDLPTFPDSADFLQVITHLESHAQPLAAIVGPGDRVVGYARLETLQKALFDRV